MNNLLHSEYNVVEKHFNDRLSDELEIHFLNLAKVKDEENFEHDEKKKKLYNWLKFIETDNQEVRKMLAQESPMMAKANATIEVMEMDPKERWLYENRMKYEHDKASWKHVGYQEGIERGSYQTKLETAKLMKQANCEIDFIMKMTGLSKDEIERI